MMEDKKISEPLIEREHDPAPINPRNFASYTWVGFACLTAIFIGIRNYLDMELSAQFSVAGSFPQFYCIIVTWIIYYSVIFCRNASLAARGQPVPRLVY